MSSISDQQAPEGFTPEGQGGFDRLVGPLFSRVGEDGVRRVGFRVGAGHVNGRNDCHGGMLVALADTAWGRPLALHNYPSGWATVRLTTDFLAPAPLGSWLEGFGVVVGRDGDLFTVRGEIWTENLMIVSGMAIYKGVRPRPAV